MDRAGQQANAAVDCRFMSAAARHQRWAVPLSSGVHSEGLRDALRARSGRRGRINKRTIRLRYPGFCSGVLDTAPRRETSAPASGGMLQNNSALVAEISDTTIQAG